MLKLVSCISSLLTVICFFIGFCGLNYITENFNWNGLMISIALAILFWLLAAFFYKVCEWATWRDMAKEREYRAVKQYKEKRKGGGDNAA